MVSYLVYHDALLQNVTDSITKLCGSYIITKCDSFNTKCDSYYKMQGLLQNTSVHMFLVVLLNKCTFSLLSIFVKRLTYPDSLNAFLIFSMFAFG